MHSPKEFLLLECDSVKSVLQETLRYEYGAEGSRLFFEECEVRLEFIRQEIVGTLDTDHVGLENNAALLNDLSDLIARIERSSIGEYSWPFVDELKKIADAICTENTLVKSKAPPKIHVLSDGGLDKYAINPEQKRPSGGTRRILTIVFPRSLKHFVLLHPILGHELGHAIWRGSEHEGALKSIVLQKLLSGNAKFNNQAATAAWMYSPQAPAEIKAALGGYQSFGIDENNFFPNLARWPAWVEEITCDLIGIATFGPSFVAALCQLLSSLVSSGIGFGRDHPPVACRISIMVAASRLLGYDQLNLSDQGLQQEVANFWVGIESQKKNDAWFDIFSDTEILETLNAIKALLAAHPPSEYISPASSQFEKLLEQVSNQIPPIDCDIDIDGEPTCAPLDFRHILYAGWVATKNTSKTSFLDINRLCEHAIMQLGAIKTYKNS